MYDYTNEVRRGVELLDRKLGVGWENRIDLGVLKLSKVHRCVIGQLCGVHDRFEYRKVVSSLCMFDSWGETSRGFNTPIGPRRNRRFAALTAAWKKEITLLRMEHGRRRPLDMGDIGPIRRKVDLEPMPETAPIKEPSPAPAAPAAPEREPVPANG